MASLGVLAIFPWSAWATENGASVYPVGVETVLPGMTPHAKETILYEFTAFYAANEMDNSAGASAVPEFKLRVFANAVKIGHSWGIPVWGGMLNSNIALPTIYQQLHIPPGKFAKSGLTNIDIGVLQLGYTMGSWHWYCQGDVFLPGAAYNKSDALNIGQHNAAAAAVGAFTYMARGGRAEISSKMDYIVNFRDAATGYSSGNELTWEYDALKKIAGETSLGVNGFLYKQTTDDRQNGVRVGDGNRGRDLALGPEARIHLGPHCGVAVKYFRDTLVQNKPRGNALWFEMGIPLSRELKR